MKNQKKIFEIKIPSWYGSITLLFKNIRGLKKLPINVSKHKFKSSYKDDATGAKSVLSESTLTSPSLNL
jgi:hypothetical protein